MLRARTTALAVIAGLALAGLFAGVSARTAAATSITPDFVAGNPSCTSLGYDFGFKVDPPNAGTYNIDAFNTVTVTTDGVNFDWESTLGMDAVISKGGPNANVYVYDPPEEAFEDTGLHSPINPSNGVPFGLSHIEFCFDYEVDVSKTAATTFKRTYEWRIDKSVTPDTWNMFTGDTGTSQYTVSVVKSAGTDSDWAVSGSITIENNTPVTATVSSVTDLISPAIAGTVVCPVALPAAIPSGGSLVCTYSAALPDGSNRTNTATVATTGDVGGGTATAPVTFGDPTTEVNDSINVDDTNGSSWQFGDSGSVSYTKTFACDADEGTHNNTATIRETGQSDSASVTVNCYELAVRKDADTSKTRTWTWRIDKTGDQTSLTLMPGQSFLVNYTVVVSATSADSNWAVSGEIVISNPNPTQAASLTAVNDIVSPAIAATVNCPALSVPAGGTLTCTYSASLPDATDRLNTATATLQNYAYDSAGAGTPSGTTDFSGTANVSFANATVTEIDECINVVDDKYGVLGTACANESPKTFTYSMYVGPYTEEECGPHTFVNVASFTANDSGATGNDNHTVNITVPCPDDGGCTLTQGYWKTHSQEGPAPYDDAWLNVGALQEDTPFFLSGKTWYEVLWTSPNGNVYYVLAHQYIAAKLNVLNGADDSDIAAALLAAEVLFAANTPAQAALLKGGAKNTWVNLATRLDQYNNGLIGPGHCSE